MSKESFPTKLEPKYFWGAPSKKGAECLISNCRDIVGQLIRFLTGHAFLKRHNAVVFHGISPPPGDVTCRLCKDPFSEETPHHIVTECEYTCAWRYETMGALLLDEYPQWNINYLIKFLRNKEIILYCEKLRMHMHVLV